jgi:apolipoprotein N-acyltransferase
LGTFVGFFAIIFNILSKQIKHDILKVALAAMIWTAVEFYRSDVFFVRFPWLSIGSAVEPTILLPMIGVYGVSFIVIFSCAAMIYKKTRVIGLILFICIALLVKFNHKPVQHDTEGIRTTVVQYDGYTIEEYIEITETLTPDDTELIVWSESALIYDVRKFYKDFIILTNFCKAMDATMVVGTKTEDGITQKDWYNTALTIDTKGKVIGEYYKMRPVHLMNDGTPGTRLPIVKSPLGNFATPICFDCDYTSIIRELVNNGAEYFAVPFLDAAYWTKYQHHQHAQIFRLRAAENARWFACSGASGISQFIDPYGNIISSLPPMEQGVLTETIYKSDKITFFTRYGWLFPWLNVLGLVAILLWAIGIIIRRMISTRTN